MDLIQAIVYGIIQGLTEFLPISSTAHLRIFPALVGWQDPGAAFTAIIQLGTVAAVLIYFAKDIAPALTAWWNSLTGKKEYDKVEARLAWAVFIGTLPVIPLALLFQHKIETTFRSLNVIAASMIGLAIVMWIAEVIGKRKRKVPDVEVKDGVSVGLWQCLALVPGMSRSGTTISGALFQGFDHLGAARFSFLLSIPSVAGAGLYETYKALKGSEAGAAVQWGPTIVATVVSFIVGYAAIAYFLKYLQKHGILVFVWYRLALGILLLFLVHRGLIDPNAGAEKPEPPTTSQAAAHIGAGGSSLIAEQALPLR